MVKVSKCCDSDYRFNGDNFIYEVCNKCNYPCTLIDQPEACKDEQEVQQPCLCGKDVKDCLQCGMLIKVGADKIGISVGTAKENQALVNDDLPEIKAGGTARLDDGAKVPPTITFPFTGDTNCNPYEHMKLIKAEEEQINMSKKNNGLTALELYEQREDILECQRNSFKNVFCPSDISWDTQSSSFWTDKFDVLKRKSDCNKQHNEKVEDKVIMPKTLYDYMVRRYEQVKIEKSELKTILSSLKEAIEYTLKKF